MSRPVVVVTFELDEIGRAAIRTELGDEVELAVRTGPAISPSVVAARRDLACPEHRHGASTRRGQADSAHAFGPVCDSGG
jgi:hypothetical protein